MNIDSVGRWTQAYTQAWQARDPDAAAALFTEDATYRVTPFGAPLHGRDAIRDYWREQTADQDDIRFRFAILGVGVSEAAVHGRTEYRRVSTDTPMVLDGVIAITLDDSERCVALRAWWQQLEDPRPSR